MSEARFEHARRSEATLNQRQREVLDLLVAGKTNGEIGDQLGMTLDGAKWNVGEILGKLGLASREDAAEYWRWRRRPAGRVASLRGIFGTSMLKWVAGGAATIGAVAVLAALFSSPEEKQGAELPPFYLEARMEVWDNSRSIGTNIAGGAPIDPEHRVANIRWWQQDIDHMRVEIETLEPAGDTGTDIIVTGQGKQVYYRFQTNTYTEAPIFEFPPEANFRTRPWSFSTFIGPWPYEAAGVDGIVEQLRRFGGPDGPRPAVEVTGRARLLGREVEVVEYSPASSASSDGTVTSSGIVRYWIDGERLMVMKQVVGGARALEFTIEATRLDWDRHIDSKRFRFEPPKDSQRVEDQTASPLADSPGGGITGTSGSSVGGISVAFPAGMWRPSSLPDGFRSVSTEAGHDAANRPISHRVEYAHEDGRRFVIDQRIRAGGPASPPAGRAVAAGLRTFYVAESAGEISLTFSDGDLTVRISSTSMTEEDLLAAAESLEPAP